MDALDKGAPLFEFAERSCVNPHILLRGVNLATQFVKCLMLPLNHKAHLLAKERRNVGSKRVEEDYKRVHYCRYRF